MDWEQINPFNMRLLAKYTLERAEAEEHDCKNSEDKQCLACYDLWELSQIVNRLDPKRTN